MRRLGFLVWGWGFAACQPIIVGMPETNEGGSSSHAGTGVSLSAGVGGGSQNGGFSQGGEAPTPSAGAGDQTDIAGDSAAGDGGAAGDGCSLRITGHLSSLRGHPIVGAQLVLSGDTEASTRSDESGNYVFTGLCPGHYELVPTCLTSGVTIDLADDQTRDFAGTPGSCEELPLRPRIEWVIFDPTASESNGLPRRLSTTLQVESPDHSGLDLMDALTALTNGHVQPQGVSYTITHADAFPALADGFSYTPESYAACLADPNTCHAEVEADYAAIERDDDLCDSVAKDDVDEIWLIGGAHFGFVPLKPLECHVVVEGIDTVKRVDLVGLHFERELVGMLSDYQARADAALREAFGPLPGSEDNPYASYVKSYPLPAEPLVTAWLAHLPQEPWLDSQGRFKDFWRYINHPNERSDPQVSALTCSSSYTPGWCSHLVDGGHGVCNDKEWAAFDKDPLRSVEMLFRPEKFVSAITLYDRACDEQVLAGHLEFSDGTPDIPFDALEQNGMMPKMFTFEPKLLRGLRVVIDQATGPHPGLGEIVIGESAKAL
ncbi:MAG TPA: carboxypeptidase-like regulatory domain-containing protein [Polyangiaceae bacterium]|nr:carboxypeptidase-like regulatory domain-containing protein [Polyangiaceae bacterium]